MSLKRHICIAFVIRTVLIVCGEIMDQYSTVSYTDIDYKVFTDAARYVAHFDSPYKRHTYRYTPLIAYLLLPNILLHRTFGKFLFSFFDVVLGIIISIIVKNSVVSSNSRPIDRKRLNDIALTSAKLWLYNPLAVVIATRGNGDAIACLFVLLSLLFVQTEIVNGTKKYILSGFFLALAIHIRLYPIIYSFSMYVALGKYHFNRDTTFFAYLKQLIPNINQITLAVSCVSTLCILTVTFYCMYGYDFIFESYTYHLLRVDVRHNFSVYFYLLYLGSAFSLTWFNVITLTVKAVTLFILSINYGSDIKKLNFCLLLQTILIVSYNAVMTSQYFIWFLALLPLALKDLNISMKRAGILFLVWLMAQVSWLFQAYLLEFKGRNTFLFIWMQGIAFFAVNMFMLVTFIKAHSQNCRIVRDKLE